MSRVVWHKDELHCILKRVEELLQKDSLLSDQKLLQEAQKILPSGRQRIVSQASAYHYKRQIAALRARAAQKVTEPPPAPRATDIPPPSPERVRGTVEQLAEVFDRVLDILAAKVAHKIADRMLTNAPSGNVSYPKHNPLPPSVPREARVGVLIIGLLPAQANAIDLKYGDRLDLTFMTSLEAETRPVLRRAHTILITQFLSHSVQAKYRSAPTLHFCNSIGVDLPGILDKL